ncbi:MAG TPA: alginate export family protein [Bdellovibrionota bacterium]|nr:alginate export family protein [Bdellovibrionota bacterium]
MNNSAVFVAFLFIAARLHAQETKPLEEVAAPTPTPSPQPAAPPKWELGGEARFRYEGRENSDFSNTTDDGSRFIGSRIRMNVTLRPMATLEGFIQPQFSGFWGQTEAGIGGGGTITGGTSTSGALKDRDLSLHQAYVKWDMNPELLLKVGRQEMNYGDAVVIGNVDFSNVGRSFDAALVRFHRNAHWIDAFYSKLGESDVADSGIGGGSDFAGAYAGIGLPEPMKALDFYTLWLRDDRAGSPTTFNFATLGARTKFVVGLVDGRFEGAFQVGEHRGEDMRAYMLDLETGYTFAVREGLRVGLEYNRASGDDSSTSTFTRFHQLFPTAHRWLGYMDILGRQNVQSGVFRLSWKPTAAWTFTSDLHTFWRVDQNDVLYSIATELPLAGQASPPTETGLHAGEELDLLVALKVNDHVHLEALGGLFFPGAYMDHVIGLDLAYFAYTQVKFSL